MQAWWAVEVSLKPMFPNFSAVFSAVLDPIDFHNMDKTLSCVLQMTEHHKWSQFWLSAAQWCLYSTAGRVLFTQHHQTRPDPVWCAVHLLPPMRRQQNELWSTLVHTHTHTRWKYHSDRIFTNNIQCYDYTIVKPYDITNALWYWQSYVSDDDGKRNMHWKHRDNTGCFTPNTPMLNAVQICRGIIKTSELINTWT